MGQTLSGKFALEQVSSGGSLITRIAASNVTLTLADSSATYVSVTLGTGSLFVSSAGIAGGLSGTVAITVPSVTVTGSFALYVNTTNAAVNQRVTIGTDVVSVDLPAGPFVRVSATGATVQVLSQTLAVDFAFSEFADDDGVSVVSVAATNVSVQFGDGTTNYLSLTNGSGAFIAAGAGLAGQLSGSVALQVPGVTLGGTIGLEFNNTVAAVSRNYHVGGETVGLSLPEGPYFRFTGEGVRLIVLGQTLSGNVAFERVLDGASQAPDAGRHHECGTGPGGWHQRHPARERRCGGAGREFRRHCGRLHGCGQPDHSRRDVQQQPQGVRQ